MKTNPATLHITALWSAAALVGLLGLSQPAGGQPATPPRIDPASGLPITDSPNSTGLNPATGMPGTNSANISSEQSVSFDSGMAPHKLHELIGYGRYAEALQLCNTFHDHAKGGALSLIIPGWIELGRRYPKAKADLLEIRDHDLREFSEGRGYCDLFQEVDSINHGLHQDDSTYALFKTIREKDPELAQQCYLFVKGLLVAKGEYQSCYDLMGDPQRKFDIMHQLLDHRLADQRRMAKLHQDTVQRMKDSNQQNGRPNFWMPADRSIEMKQFAEDSFVGETRQLIEILVATGHKSDAEKIRDEAVAILDKPQLRSAVSDAVEKIQKLSVPNKK